MIYSCDGEFIKIAEIAGSNKIEGVVKNKNGDIYASCGVKIFHQERGELLYTQRSDKNGKYLINNIAFEKGPFFVIAHDPKKKYNGVIADNIGANNEMDE